MPFSKVVFYYLWIMPHVLLLAILAGMLRRRIHRGFLIFFTYAAFEVVQFAVLFSLIWIPKLSTETYFYIYCAGLALSTALRFGIIHEIFAHVFREYVAFSRFGRPLFRWILVVLIVAAVLLTVYTGGDNSDHELYVLYVLNHTALILQAGLLLALFMVSWYLNLSWRYPIFGIALGFGIFLSVELIVTAIRFKTGFSYGTSLNYVTMAAWHGSVLLWLFYLWAPVRTLQPESTKLPEHSDVEAWNQELQRLIHR